MPAQFRALYQQSAQQEPRLEFRLRNQANSAGALTLKQLIDEHARQYAREVVAANESNGYRMSLQTFLALWEDADKRPTRQHAS
jgi:hypothetical protein